MDVKGKALVENKVGSFTQPHPHCGGPWAGWRPPWGDGVGLGCGFGCLHVLGCSHLEVGCAGFVLGAVGDVPLFSSLHTEAKFPVTLEREKQEQPQEPGSPRIKREGFNPHIPLGTC